MQARRTPAGPTEAPVENLLHAATERRLRGYLEEDYSSEAYTEQFTVRILELRAKTDRIEGTCRSEAGVPEELFRQLREQGKRPESLRARKGDPVSPFEL